LIQKKKGTGAMRRKLKEGAGYKTIIKEDYSPENRSLDLPGGKLREKEGNTKPFT